MAAHVRGLNMMGKPVFLHLNGDSFKRKRIVVNQRDMKSFESFLDAASLSFRTPAREIRTPLGRHRINTLDDLQRDCSYVVVGRGPFKKVGYEVKEKPLHQQVKLPEINFVQLNHRKFRNVPGRARIYGQRKREEIKTIIVFCNGVVAKPKRVQLRTDFKMPQILECVNEKVSTISKNGAVYELFTVDGHKITEPSQLDSNGQYVAVGRERFFDKSVCYNDQGVAAQLTPRRASTKPKVAEIKPLRKAGGGTKRGRKKKSIVSDDEDHNKTIPALVSLRDAKSVSSPESPREVENFRSFEDTLESVADNDLHSELVEDTPLRSYAATKDSSQEQDIEEIPLDETIKEDTADVLGDSGVPLEEIINERQGSGSADVKPSVYEASGEHQVAAGEIQDDRETLEDKPIDQLPAEEVEDEEIEENVNQNDGDEGVNVRQSEEVKDEEIIEDNNDLTPPEEIEPSDEAVPGGENEQSEENRPSDDNRPTEEIEPINDNNAIEENEPSRDDEPSEENRPINDYKPSEENEINSDKKPSEENEPVGDDKPSEENEPIGDDKPSEENQPSRVNKPSEELIEEHKPIDSN